MRLSLFRVAPAIGAVIALVACAASPRIDADDRVARRDKTIRATTAAAPVSAGPASETPPWWFAQGAAAAHANLPTFAHAKNVIVFLGDGMSIPTITAARILDGQRKGGSGEENRLHFENFPATALSKTYEADQQTPDSAGTMTAIMTGVKTRAGFIGVDQVPHRGDCAGSHGHELVSALELAAAARMDTGFVSTARVTHATPAATYGHLAERNWETDMDMPAAVRAAGCADFARQLVEFPIAGGINVALGGGRSGFMPQSAPDPEYPNRAGKRGDGRNLIGEWQRQAGAAYVWNTTQLAAIDPSKTRHLLGLFEPGHMQYETQRGHDPAGEPGLAEMTRAAIAVLQNNPRGYFLMVEAGRIDHAHHAGNAFRALTETIALADAVKVADQMTSESDTLILVTADHSHTLTFAGYATRGNPILGKVRGSSGEGAPNAELARDATGHPYTTLSYANGPGYAGASDLQPEGTKRFPHQPKSFAPATGGRPDLTAVDTEDPDYEQEATVPLAAETHGGDDVAVFARGPGAAAVHGSIEENVLFHVIAQNTDAIREELCRLGSCDAAGIPIRQPARARWLELVGTTADANLR